MCAHASYGSVGALLSIQIIGVIISMISCSCETRRIEADIANISLQLLSN